MLIAEERGIVNAADFLRACARTGLPLFLGLAILEKESHGENVYGHDAGGAMSVPRPQVVQVTEENFREFRRLIDSGVRSNGVGPMQITYKGYFPLAEAEGLRLWIPADNMFFGCRILAQSLGRQLRTKPPVDAFWEVARAWNGGSNPDRGREFADDAVRKARVWFALVGNSDVPTFTF